MKKTLSIVFIALCLVVCIVPSVGLLGSSGSESIGNETKATPPQLQNSDGSFNTQFLPEMGAYFEKVFAFRPQAITADAEIQANVFGVSNVDSVVVGTDGWLYYASTLDDYLGRNTLTDVQVAGVVHNLSLIQRYVESTGARFMFTIAPNKNTLYPGHMPYYYDQRVSNVRNRDLVRDALAQSDVRYYDLFRLFEEQEETLYFKRDSHWNNKGALLAYNELLSALGKQHDDYAAATVERRQDFVGDLDAMVFPAAPSKEYNYDYGAEKRYSYVTPTQSVEDPTIRTENQAATGSLYMYRDSFGNALLPFFASAYRNAHFTKSFPMILEYDLRADKPDAVLFELAERNISWLIKSPPIVESPKVTGVTAQSAQPQSVKLSLQECPSSPLYLQLSGTMDCTGQEGRPVVYVALSDARGKHAVYECFDYLSEDGSDGFLAYLNADEYGASEELTVSVIVKSKAGITEVCSGTVKIGDSDEN